MKKNNFLKNAQNSLNNLRQNPIHNFAMNHSMMIYNKNALYTFIPKNGCSTLRLSVAIENGCIEGIEQGHWIHSNNGTFNATLGEAIKADYTFTILRCPFRRLSSVFLDKFVAKEPEAWQYRQMLGRQVELDNLTFKDFVLSLKKGWLLTANIHWRKQVDFLLYQEYSDYFCLENFPEAIDTLREKIGFTVHDARPLTNHGSDGFEIIDNNCFANTCGFDISVMKRNGQCPSHKAMYNDELIETVRELYREDISLYTEKFGPQALLF
ncbi:sulfotransferase family 2 domain-containing protein [Alteromonas sp. C1M14]|uniref:sulfotransferase family 2 domain-containing protein n=1 Tax=Alteromonas sp. C1M14 TaxID=2841567 RepID=UPI001C0A008A|nr:sulfotransferase family 2 domain-containing protein [Alteromonas sp. C1M14]MBU2977226.1 sulfotransferase family protein [Alteromonas sp. C1M14]